jgi:pre-mRNA-splicing factor CWC22
LALLLDYPFGDSVQLAIAFVKECGQKLLQVNSRGLNCIISSLKALPETSLTKYSHDMIKELQLARKHQFKQNPAISIDLDMIYV